MKEMKERIKRKIQKPEIDSLKLLSTEEKSFIRSGERKKDENWVSRRILGVGWKQKIQVVACSRLSSISLWEKKVQEEEEKFDDDGGEGGGNETEAADKVVFMW
ncbi:hypothetical protein RUM43_009708 [Polyplax serrata]|uniref:Uncharacterized protein n=1 Tax=Polyplax serrata TaxID=468196 RepID=A0AAN8S6U7_POLSC